MKEEDQSGVEVVIDLNRCVGSTLCVMVAPRSFRLGPGGQSVALDPIGDEPGKVLNAAVQCPMGAITVRDADSGDVLFPREPGGPSGVSDRP
ncbi:MAG: ferredoxin [Anaerolineae bacterium]